MEGTQNILAACDEHHVKRLVVTSDIVTMTASPPAGTSIEPGTHKQQPKPGQHYDESYHSIPEGHAKDDFYGRSKTLAERLVWGFHKELCERFESKVEAFETEKMVKEVSIEKKQDMARRGTSAD